MSFIVVNSKDVKPVADGQSTARNARGFEMQNDALEYANEEAQKLPGVPFIIYESRFVVEGVVPVVETLLKKFNEKGEVVPS